ncbi:hypothetical protein MMC07_003496 [Pseudocyphellaria aurata]|nr:hypothetical protein [Pseudocyphellaria aurata]
MTANGPLPTTLVFLNDLSFLPKGSKVRFLGCVTGYSIKTGILSLQHAYPPPPHRTPTAWVDVNLLLSTLKTTDTQRGEWVNVVGYVEGRISNLTLEQRDRKGRPDEIIGVKLQAIMLWSAGDVQVGNYERTLAERKHLQRGIQTPEECENNGT